VTQWHCNLF